MQLFGILMFACRVLGVKICEPQVVWLWPPGLGLFFERYVIEEWVMWVFKNHAGGCTSACSEWGPKGRAMMCKVHTCFGTEAVRAIVTVFSQLCWAKSSGASLRSLMMHG